MMRRPLSGLSRSFFQQFIALALVAIMLGMLAPPTLAASGLRDAGEKLATISSHVGARIKELAASAKSKASAKGGAVQRESQDGSMPPRQEVPGVRPPAPPAPGELEARVASIRVNPGELTIQSHEPVSFSAIPLDSRGKVIQGLHVEWDSSNRAVLLVNRGGEVVGGAPGNANLMVRAGGVTQSVPVTVIAGSWGRFGRKKTEDSRREPRGVGQVRNAVSSTTSNAVSQADIPEKTMVSGSVKLAHARKVRRLEAPEFLNSGAPNPPAPVRAPSEDPLPDGETPSLYAFPNTVGSPRGKTSGNRNFSFGLPVVSLPGRGLDVSLSLVYNSLLWNKSAASGYTYLTYDVDAGWPAPGFRLGFGQIEDQGSYGFTLTGADGTRHALAYTSTDEYDTNDGSFIHYHGGGGAGTLYYPNGTQIVYGAGGSGQRIYPTKIIDRNGNYITISYEDSVGPKISSITDTLERNVTFQYDPTSKDLVSITSPGLGSNDDLEVMHFFYKATDIDLNQSGMFSGSVTPIMPPYNTAHVLEYVYLSSSSDGSSPHIGYKFDYSPYGMIYQTTQYRGMTIGSSSVTSNGTLATQTTYGGYPTTPSNLSDAPTFSSRTDEWAGRTTGGSAPSYAFSVTTNSTESVTKVTAPDGTINKTRALVNPGYWSDGLVTDTYVEYGSTPTVLSHTKMDWEQDSNSSNPRVYQVSTTDVPAGLTRATVLSYSTYDNVSVVSERAFTGDNSVGTEIRRTETSYATDSSSSSPTAYINRHLLHLPTMVKVFSGTSAASQVDYAYDQYGSSPVDLIGRSGLVMHEPSFDPVSGSYDSATYYRGNVTSVTTYTNAATASGSTTHTTKYDIAGNVTSAQVNCCQTKTIDYSSTYKYAYPTSVISGDPNGLHLTSSATYDFHTGLPATSTDENGEITTNYYNADSLRLNHIQNPTGGGSTYFYYGDGLVSDAASHYHYWVNVSTQLNSSDWVDSYRFYTGRGEVAQTFSDGTGSGPWNSQVIRYNEVGQVSLTTNPFSTGGYGGGLHVAGGDPVTIPSYDHLGRVTSVTMPSGDAANPTTAQATTTYDGVFTTVSDPAQKVRRQKVDEFGRVIRLDEPTSSGLGSTTSPNQSTSYVYDVLDNLVKVTQGDQNRYFKYDSLSHLVRERQVEQTVNSSYNLSDSLTGNSSWTRKIEYDEFGLVSHSYDARGVQTDFTYDDLNRLSQVSYSDSTPTAHYYYDSATGLPTGAPSSTPDSYSPGYAAGRLVAATYGSGATGNYFRYDNNGRVTTQFQLTGSTPTKYKLSYGYNYAGMLTSETYPSSRVMTYAYGYGGKLSSVSDGTTTFAGSFTYDPSGGLTSETWGNTAVHTLGYNRALQTSQVKLSVNSSEKQRYDYLYGEVTQSSGSVDTTKNTGQIARIDGTINGSGTKEWDQRFGYDELGRLSVAAEYQQGTGSTPTWKAKYTYDVYGNRQQSGSTDNAGIGFVPVVGSDITAASNRFISTGSTPITYDESGNITQDMKFRISGSLGMKYEYDANGRQAAAKLSDNTTLQTSVYDTGGQRVQTVAGGTTRTMVYDIFGQDVADYTGSTGGSLERENIYRGGQLLATQEYGQTSTENVTWTNMTGVSASGNNLTKTAANGWGNGGAVSTQAIASGDGYAEFSADSLDYGMYGLSYGETNQSYADIDFALYTERAEGRVYVYESGTQIGQYGTWTNGDRFRVAVESGVVKYYKNSTLLYTSSATLTYPLLVDTSLYSGGNTLTNVVISGNLSGGTGSLKYVLQDVQGSTRATINNNGSSSAVVARHDYLPFGEEISSGIGLRTTTTQGYGATDTNRQKYGLTERDDATGLDHTWFRKYENLSGRMTSPDPYNGSMTIGDAQSFNRYSYTQNDPVNFVDPSGLNMDGSQGSGYCIRYHYTNPSTGEGFWGRPTCYGGGGGGGGSVPLNKEDQKKYDKKRAELLRRGISQACAEFLSSHHIDPNDVTSAIEQQRPFSGPQSTISRLNAGVRDFESAAWGNSASLFPTQAAADAQGSVNLDFHGSSKAETGILPGGNNPGTIGGRSNVYFSGGGIKGEYIFHEALHSVTGFGDRNLALQLGLSPLGNPSGKIQKALKAHGCVK